MSVWGDTAAGAVVPFHAKKPRYAWLRIAAFVLRGAFRNAGAARSRPAPRTDQPVLRRPAAIPLMVR